MKCRNAAARPSYSTAPQLHRKDYDLR
ncbi:hypothetical protein NSND_63233 [Nitrospira sp. ND1]|nr:hypothetical protein NSND_63233 [Nitrospira sp. ND1]